MANYYDPKSSTYYKENGESSTPVFDSSANPNMIESMPPEVEEKKPWYMVRSNQILIVAGVFVFYWIFIKKSQSPPVIGNIVD